LVIATDCVSKKTQYAFRSWRRRQWSDIAAPQRIISTDSKQGIFNAVEAVESLHAQLVRIEALAIVACELADRLQPPSGRERKRELIRMQSFVGQTAFEASEKH
jgi:hypothetical protein